MIHNFVFFFTPGIFTLKPKTTYCICETFYERYVLKMGKKFNRYTFKIFLNIFSTLLKHFKIKKITNFPNFTSLIVIYIEIV